MKVIELLGYLKELPPDSEIIMSKDDEGNAYRHVHGVEATKVIELDTYQPYAIHPLDEDEYDDAVDAVLIF